jgi:hypothetical protein
MAAPSPSGSESGSESESEIRAKALDSLRRYDRFQREMFDSRAFSEEVDDGDVFNGYNFFDAGYDDGYLNGEDHVESEEGKDRGGKSSSRSRSESRQARSTSRKSCSKSRSVSPVKSSSHSAVRLPRDKAHRLRKWIIQGIPKEESKALRERVKLEFEGSFKLQCPKVDESMARQLSRGRGNSNVSGSSSRKPVDFVEKSWLSSQYQVLDGMRPLIKIWNSKSPDDPDNKDLESSIQLLSGAFANITKMRRANVLRQVAPRMMSLLDDPSVFSSRQSERLFGYKFLDALLKETEESDKLARLGRVGGPINRSMWSHSSNRGGGHRFTPYQGQSRRGRDGGYHQRTQHQQRGQQQYRCVSPFLSPCCFALPPSTFGDIEVGARLLKFASAWFSFTSDPWVLSVVTGGYLMDFIEEPFQSSFPPDCVTSAEMSVICDQEVEALLQKKAIFQISRPVDGFVSNMFTIKKKRENENDPQLWRPIVNLKHLNSFIQYEHFKMEGLDSVKFIMRKDDWMVKVDLTDAYFVVPVAVEHQKFLRFVWKGQFYQYVCLAFGLCSAPRVFTKILKPVVAWLRAQGVRLVIYLDDFLIMADSISLLRKHLDLTINILNHLGFLINEKKSVFTPSQVIEFLGTVVDSNRLSFSLPLAKVRKVTHLCEKALQAEKISLRQLATVIGNFSWAIPTVPFAQAHFRSLQRFFIYESRRFKGDLNQAVSLPISAKVDLEWWYSNLHSFNGKAFISNEPDMVIYSDASRRGWGACCEEATARGPWTLQDQGRHINELELLGAFYALQVFTQHSNDVSVHLYLDNSTSVSYINKCGGTHSKNLCDLATVVINWCEARNIKLVAFHLPGSLNLVADRESRAAMDASDWMLDRRIFAAILSLWEIKTDLFANAWNAQLPSFVSWFRQPLALTTNAFSLCWKGRLGYAFPPFILIPKCLAKVRREKASLVLVCPWWPAQAWFPLLLELAADVPRIMWPQSHLLTNSVQGPHPLNGSLILTAWKISGNVSETNVFQRRLSVSCLAPTVHLRSLLTSPPGTVGVIGVLNGISIPCLMI